MGNCDAEIDCEVNRVIDQILREDRLESMGLDPRPDSCQAEGEEAAEEPHKNCAIETSARFSIRILEALRAVQRQKSTHKWPSCTMEEVVQYIRLHFHYDGDLCSQVETALDQVTAQGFVCQIVARADLKTICCYRFVLKMGVNRYHLVGPFACGVPKPSKIGSCNRNRPNSRAPRTSRDRRIRPNTQIANSTLTAPGYPDPSLIDRLSTVSDIGDLQQGEFQNRNNRERSLIRENGHPFNEDQDISILEEIQAPGFNESDDVHGGGREAGNHSFDENIEEMNPPVRNEPIRRPGGGGGGGRGRVVRDQSFDENVEEIHPPGANESIRELGGRNGHAGVVLAQSSDRILERIQNPDPDGAICGIGGCGGRQPVVQEHSSDENMYCVEPAVDNTLETPRRQRRRDSSSSRSSSNTASSGCPARRSRRNTFHCSSDADVSDDTDADESEDARPWVRNCQNQNNRTPTRRGRRCSSCVYN